MVFSHFAIPPIKNTGYFKGVQSDDSGNIYKTTWTVQIDEAF